MATFQDLQNRAIWRLRQRGVNFGGQPGNLATDAAPPYIIAQLLNEGYSEFIAATMEAQLVTLKLPLLTATYDPLYAPGGTPLAAGMTASQIQLRPLPPTGNLNGTTFTPTIINPAAMRVDAVTYTVQAGVPVSAQPGPTYGEVYYGQVDYGGSNQLGFEYTVDLCSAQKFIYRTGGYTRRLSWFGPRVIYAARIDRKPVLDLAPNCATLGDVIKLTVVPDPINSPTTCLCSNGGMMQAATDVPLIDPEFHNALVEYVVMNAGDALDKGGQVQRAAEKWDSYIAKALWKGAIEDGGYPTVSTDIYTEVVVRE